MPNIRPFQDYDEKDVINLYAFSGTLPATKGTLVKIQGNGWVSTGEANDMIGAAGEFSVGNTVAQRYGVAPKVAAAGTGDRPLGVLLYDVRETDENGNKLIYRPQKMYEMECVLSGQAVPVLTRGVILYSGTTGTPTAGGLAYAGPSGGIEPFGTYTVGKFLGVKDTKGFTLIMLDC